jgi:hypothetical protein
MFFHHEPKCYTEGLSNKQNIATSLINDNAKTVFVNPVIKLTGKEGKISLPFLLIDRSSSVTSGICMKTIQHRIPGMRQRIVNTRHRIPGMRQRIVNTRYRICGYPVTHTWNAALHGKYPASHIRYSAPHTRNTMLHMQ